LIWPVRWRTLAQFQPVFREAALLDDAEMLAGVTAEPAIRISGLRRGNRVLLLVADYWKPPGTKSVKVTVPVEVESRVIDLDTSRDVALVKPGQNSFTVDLDRELARVFQVRPKE